mmetsp:Transcript_9346/g.16267  ORF Transcript_9346/g.16267 Transcript_9346/m.16267 type:complete len:256 (+) Transcript_9346:15-782(+)
MKAGKSRALLIPIAAPHTVCRNVMPVLPMLVTQPIVPSDLTLTFVRVRPVASSFLPHSRTSTISPAFSFFVFLSSLSPILKEPVKIVSLTTFIVPPPSFKKTVPWLPTGVSHPSTPSDSALTWRRPRPIDSSMIGPLITSITSSGSSRRTVLLSLMLQPSEMTVAFNTFMNCRIMLTKLSLLIAPSFSLSKYANSLLKSPSAMPASSASSPSLASFGSFSQDPKNLIKSASLMLSSLSPSMESKTSAFDCCFAPW